MGLVGGGVSLGIGVVVRNLLDSIVIPRYNSSMSDVIQINPEILSGTPTFKGTRVPLKNLFDYIEAGSTVDEFIDDFPSVKREQVAQLLNELREDVVSKTKVA